MMKSQKSSLDVQPLINEELKLEQARLIEEYIVNSATGKNKFLVLDNEAGFGKSLMTNAAISSTNKKVIFVKKYLSEANEAEDDIRNSLDFYNLIYDESNKKVIVINASNSSHFENESIEEMQNAHVLIISHKKYQILANDDKKREIYVAGRDILIIDEYLEPEIVTIDASYFENNKYLFTHDIGETEYIEVRNKFLQIIDFLKTDKENRVGNLRVLDSFSELEKDLSDGFLDSLKNDIYDLKEIFEVNRFKLVNRQLEKIKDGAINYYTYQVFFTELELFFRQQFIYDNFYTDKRIATNLFYEYWTLNNNIILDASARILHGYKLRPDIFKRESQGRVFDYSHTTCHIKSLNISKTDIKKKFGDTPNKSMTLPRTRRHKETLIPAH